MTKKHNDFYRSKDRTIYTKGSKWNDCAKIVKDHFLSVKDEYLIYEDEYLSRVKVNA